MRIAQVIRNSHGFLVSVHNMMWDKCKCQFMLLYIEKRQTRYRLYIRKNNTLDVATNHIKSNK